MHVTCASLHGWDSSTCLHSKFGCWKLSSIMTQGAECCWQEWDKGYLQEGDDLTGNPLNFDYAYKGNKVTLGRACERACKAHVACRGYTYHPSQVFSAPARPKGSSRNRDAPASLVHKFLFRATCAGQIKANLKCTWAGSSADACKLFIAASARMRGITLLCTTETESCDHTSPCLHLPSLYVLEGPTFHKFCQDLSAKSALSLRPYA